MQCPEHALTSVKSYFIHLQQQIMAHLEQLDEQQVFMRDPWQREHSEQSNGEGLSCILNQGRLFERAGVNFSHIHGQALPHAATATKSELIGRSYHAMGVSVVIHPLNPYVPTSHANIRFILTEKANEPPRWWFGGGFDLTPYYGFVEDCRHWHQTAKQACDPFGTEIYPQFKAACDRYFYLPHRQEARGIGGLFFDDFQKDSFENSFNFARSIGDHFMQAYAPIVERRQALPFGPREKKFQHYRRGRYVEFNLVYDRGTLFGLQSGGRTESILMSLPPEVSWAYNWQPENGSPEASLYTDYLPAREWV